MIVENTKGRFKIVNSGNSKSTHYTVKKAAQVLDCSVQHINLLCRNGELNTGSWKDHNQPWATQTYISKNSVELYQNNPKRRKRK